MLTLQTVCSVHPCPFCASRLVVLFWISEHLPVLTLNNVNQMEPAALLTESEFNDVIKHPLFTQYPKVLFFFLITVLLIR